MKKNILKNIGTALTLISISSISAITAYADPLGGLTSAKSSLDSQVKPIVNTIVIPIVATVLLIVLILAIARSVVSYRKGYEIELGHIILLVIGSILVTTFPTWGWAMIGV